MQAYRNQVASTTNYGIAIAGGHDSAIFENRIVSSGYLADGLWITAQNVGIYIWDLYDTGSSSFYDNSASNNLVGWRNKNGRNDWWIPDATSFTGNVSWAGNVTL
ncbi:MAG: hypothetical protein M3478_07935 [Planctomycetota bacterium]|nr:hypothetical protein [Planctomycetota bacterium]